MGSRRNRGLTITVKAEDADHARAEGERQGTVVDVRPAGAGVWKVRVDRGWKNRGSRGGGS